MILRMPILVFLLGSLAVLAVKVPEVSAQAPTSERTPLPSVQEVKSIESGPVAEPRIVAPTAALPCGRCQHAGSQECAVCVPVPSPKKSTGFNYESKKVTHCVPKHRCTGLFCLFHHHTDSQAIAVPITKRVLIKHKVTKETAGTKFEAQNVPSNQTLCKRHGIHCKWGTACASQP